MKVGSQSLPAGCCTRTECFPRWWTGLPAGRAFWNLLLSGTGPAEPLPLEGIDIVLNMWGTEIIRSVDNSSWVTGFGARTWMAAGEESVAYCNWVFKSSETKAGHESDDKLKRIKNVTKLNTCLRFQTSERGWRSSSVLSAALDSLKRKPHYRTFFFICSRPWVRHYIKGHVHTNTDKPPCWKIYVSTRGLSSPSTLESQKQKSLLLFISELSDILRHCNFFLEWHDV